MPTSHPDAVGLHTHAQTAHTLHGDAALLRAAHPHAGEGLSHQGVPTAWQESSRGKKIESKGKGERIGANKVEEQFPVLPNGTRKDPAPQGEGPPLPSDK